MSPIDDTIQSPPATTRSSRLPPWCFGLCLAVTLTLAFVGVLLFVGLLLDPLAGAAGGCGGG